MTEQDIQQHHRLELEYRPEQHDSKDWFVRYNIAGRRLNERSVYWWPSYCVRNLGRYVS